MRISTPSASASARRVRTYDKARHADRAYADNDSDDDIDEVVSANYGHRNQHKAIEDDHRSARPPQWPNTPDIKNSGCRVKARKGHQFLEIVIKEVSHSGGAKGMKDIVRHTSYTG